MPLDIKPLEEKASSIITKGWTPVNNKNLVTFATISTLMLLVALASYQVGAVQQRAVCDTIEEFKTLLLIEHTI